MTTAAAILTSVWFLTAFVIRIAIQVRRTGDSGVRMTSSLISLAGATKVLFTAATIAVGVGPALVAADVMAPAEALNSAPGRWLGLGLAVAGIVATFVAQLAMGRSWRIGVDPAEHTDLVTGGVFAVVRNPIFSTMLVTSAGLTLMVPTAVGVAATALMLVALELQVRGVEEPYLHSTHGAAFAAYTARVGRFVPVLGRQTR